MDSGGVGSVRYSTSRGTRRLPTQGGSRKQRGERYRLPSESEWEYAARSVGKDDIWAGTSDKDELYMYAVYRFSSGDGTAEVGSKKSNALGLFDMSGNVSEWVEDCWHKFYTGFPTDGSTWLESNGGNCSLRVLRGGSWVSWDDDLQTFRRLGFYVLNRTNFVVFRLVQDIP